MILLFHMGLATCMRPSCRQLPHEIRRQVVDHEIDRAVPELEPPHRVVGDHLEHQPVVARTAGVVLLEGRQHEPVVGDELREAILTGSDRRARRRRRSRPARCPSPG